MPATKKTRQEFYEAVKAVSKAAAGLEEHHREVVAKGMEDTPTLRTIASETKKSLLHRVDVSTVFLSVVSRQYTLSSSVSMVLTCRYAFLCRLNAVMVRVCVCCGRGLR